MGTGHSLDHILESAAFEVQEAVGVSSYPHACRRRPRTFKDCQEGVGKGGCWVFSATSSSLSVCAADCPGGHFWPCFFLSLDVLIALLYSQLVSFPSLVASLFPTESLAFYRRPQPMTGPLFLPVHWPVTGELTSVLELFPAVVLVLSAVLQHESLDLPASGFGALPEAWGFQKADLWLVKVSRRNGRTMAFKVIV